MQPLALIFVIAAISGVAGSGGGATSAPPRYEVKVASSSRFGLHPPFLNGTFWLGDDIFLWFRDPSIGRGLFRKYRVCWTFTNFGYATCRVGYVSSGWPDNPLQFRARYNDNVVVRWFVDSRVVKSKTLRITGE